MNSIANLMNSFVSCPTTTPVSAAASVLASSASDSFKELFNPANVLCLLALLSITIATVLCIFGLKAVLTSAAVESLVFKFNEAEFEIQMNSINRSRSNKRLSIDYSQEEPVDAPEVKSPKLMDIGWEEETPKIKSRRNSLPKSSFKTIELEVEIQEILFQMPTNQERITLIEDEPIMKKRFESYLRWDFPDSELETLNYAEKARRFYHLTNYGEVQFESVEQACCEETAVGFYHLPIKPPEEELKSKPINLITNLVNQTINIPSHLMYLLKKNHQLVSSFLKNLSLRKEDLIITSVLTGRIDYSMLMMTRKFYITPIIKLPPAPKAEKMGKIEKVEPGKPLTKEQLRNILYIIGY